jgi:signal transduction histidine kinase
MLLDVKVQTRLTVLCSGVFGIIFAIIALVIFGLYYNNTKQLIYKNLDKIANISALFYLEEDELNAYEFEKIKKQFEEIVSNDDYQVYNEVNQICYGEQQMVIPADILDKIRSEQRLSFTTDEHLCYGIFYEDNQGDFVIIAKEKRNVLDEQIHLLLWILLTCFLTGLIAIVLLSRWVSHIAYRPFSKIINQVNNISMNNLDVQIESPGTKDELQDLIDTFNKLLAKISETFVIQKNFVSYVSHEFKTPLASMLGHLEVFSIKDRSAEEYKEVTQKLIQQIYQLDEILDTLIVISDLRKEMETMIPLRIDELLWEIIDKISETYMNPKISVNIDIQPEDEPMLSITKNRTQLFMALFNLIDNAVKYSPGKLVEIRLYKEDEHLQLSITDKGIGIPPNQMEHISKPFYRADNAQQIQGSGIGLSIALLILEKNQIKYHIHSETGIGTCVLLSLF